jgi:hypothetical protein
VRASPLFIAASSLLYRLKFHLLLGMDPGKSLDRKAEKKFRGIFNGNNEKRLHGRYDISLCF